MPFPKSKSFLHVVLFKMDMQKLKEEFPGDELQKGVHQLRVTIPGLIEVQMNERNVAPWAGYNEATQGYTHVLVSRHVDAKALRVYAEDPTHKALQQRFLKCITAPPCRVELNTVDYLSKM